MRSQQQPIVGAGATGPEGPICHDGRVTAPDGYIPAARSATPPDPTDLCLPVCDRDLLLWPDGRVPTLAQLPEPAELVPIGTLDGQPLWAANLPTRPDGLTRLDWGLVASTTRPALTQAAARAMQIVTWRAQHRWCGACRTELAEIEWYVGRSCPQCGLSVFATAQPVALVAILRDGPDGREILLARHSYRDTQSWLLVGGWVDPAESLEQAAIREAQEEVGLAVTDLVYWGSEAWGMAGPGILVSLFLAAPVDPDAPPQPDPGELAEARYFPLRSLPAPLPPLHHISGRLLTELASTAELASDAERASDAEQGAQVPRRG
jgi:NAD+ diphosphatase